MPYLIDTDIMIDVSRKNVGAANYVDSLERTFDSLITATAMEESLTLATLNRKHYHMIDGLSLEGPKY